jgi:hypothetical protein
MFYPYYPIDLVFIPYFTQYQQLVKKYMARLSLQQSPIKSHEGLRYKHYVSQTNNQVDSMPPRELLEIYWEIL